VPRKAIFAKPNVLQKCLIRTSTERFSKMKMFLHLQRSIQPTQKPFSVGSY